MAHDIPTLPVAHARALALVSDSDVNVSELATVVEADPALTVAVLRAANSAYSAPVDRISTAQQGVVRIGLDATRHIVTSAVVGEVFSELDTALIDSDELWRHLIACALISDVTAWGKVESSTAFTAGLLHDVGRLAMAQREPDQYARAVKLMRMQLDPLDAETRVFGFDHLEWGVTVARTWDISDEIVQAIGDHHIGEQGPLAWVVWNARRIAWSLGIGDGLESPSFQSYDPESEDAKIVDALGGAEHLLTTIDWYRGATTSAKAA